MKFNKIFSLLLVAGATAMVGCSDDFLEVQKPDGEPLEEYYTTEAHLNEALIAAYDPIHWPDWGLGQYNALNIDGEVMGDNVFVGGSNRDDMHNWHLLANYEADADNTFSSLWTVDYSGIKRCNDVLKYLEWWKEKNLDGNYTDAKAALIEMQARMLRVYYYNMLWHYFGNVPFYLVNLEAPYTAPQLKADEVYDNIITELEAVLDANVLPAKFYKNSNGADDAGQLGRVTQDFGYMLYAEMVMYQNDEGRLSKALGYMRDIINSGRYSLNPDFADIWETNTGEWCSESIWEINYSQTNHERGWSSPLAIGGTILPCLISPNGFPGDELWNGGNDGWGFMPVRNATYNMFPEGDLRRDATVWVISADVEYTKRYSDTHMWVNKYRPKQENLPSDWDINLNYDNNLRVYRYAETLLNAAELAIRTGAAGDAATWLNLVRNRAGLASIASPTVNNVLTERHLEFVGEGKRYFDLVRAEGISGAGAENKATTALVPATDDNGQMWRTNSWTPQKKYIPIAQGELDSDPALVQNNY